MLKMSARCVLLCLAALLAAAPVFADVMPQKNGISDVDARVAEAAALYSWVSSFERPEKSSPFVVDVPTQRLAALKSHQPNGGPLWIGVDADVDFSFTGADKAAFGSTFYADGVMVWSGSFVSPGASGLRLRLEDVNLPKGAALYAFDRHGQAFGPYSGKAAQMWTNTVAGEELILQLHLPMSHARQATASLFRVAGVSHMGDRYAFGRSASDKAFCSWNDSCIINAECANIPSAIQSLQEGVAYLLYTIGNGTYLCTGGLLNDTANSGTPYLLTANHCFDTSSSASSLEAYFQWTVGCGSSCGTQYFPPGTVPRTNGSTLLATSANTDFTLVQLNQPAPSGTTFLGWTTTPVANSAGTQLFRVSHPAGSPQAYSEHEVNTSAGACGTLPRGDFIYSDATLADTEGGSSGSPVLNGSGQVVGQLFGACGATPSTTCDNDDRTVDGAFAVTFPSVSQWLDPGSGPTCGNAGDSCSSNSDCCSNKCRGRRGNKTCR